MSSLWWLSRIDAFVNSTLERVWRGYALMDRPATDIARMVYRELELEIVRLERSQVAIATSLDDDDNYVPNFHNAVVGM